MFVFGAQRLVSETVGHSTCTNCQDLRTVISVTVETKDIVSLISYEIPPP